MRMRTSARRTPRLVVSFSGLDGAGKTRQIDALVAELQKQGRTEVLWVPFRVWPETLLSRLPASFRSALGPKRRSASVIPARTRPRGMAAVSALPPRLLWTAIASVAAVSAGLSLRRRVARSNADVLVLDRYRIDSIVKLQYWYPEARATLLVTLVAEIAPTPDLEVYLRVDARVAYQRKPEQWTADQLARQARLYDRLIERIPSVLVLEGDDDPEALADAVRHAVGSLL